MVISAEEVGFLPSFPAGRSIAASPLPNSASHINSRHKLTSSHICLMRVVTKNEYFTVRLTVRRGGGGSAPSALTVSKCENFDLFFIKTWFFDTQNTSYLIVKLILRGGGPRLTVSLTVKYSFFLDDSPYKKIIFSLPTGFKYYFSFFLFFWEFFIFSF